MIFGKSNDGKKVRYAVVGLGYIAQIAVLPAFEHATENSEITALVSGDAEKLEELGGKYNVKNLFSYEQYNDLLDSGLIDAVYLALPNDMHCDYTVRAAERGIHVLCEKPMAVSEEECLKMIDVCSRHNVKLMIAYRLHFEEANLRAIDLVHSGRIGEPRIFNSVFTMQVQEHNIRIDAEHGGGPLYDIGIYCINAARYIFQAEPIEVLATSARSSDPRFSEVEEMVSVMLRFPNERLAAFTASFGAADVSSYQVVGTKGDLIVSPAYEYAGKLEHHLTVEGKKSHSTFSKRDQFAPELLHFSTCVIEDENPLPSGAQGLADIRVIEACYRSIFESIPVSITPVPQEQRPNISFQIKKPAVKKPELVNAQEASR